MASLAALPLFEGVDETVLARLESSCAWRTYEEGELVIDYEDETDDVRFIASGWVRIIVRLATGREMILAEMKEGDYFGELAAIDGSTRSANVTSISRSQMCIMPRAVFMAALEDHKINRRVLTMFASRIRQLNGRLAEHSFLQTKHRLYCELLRLSRPRLGHEGQRCITPPPTQKELAARIGTRREVVSREIANMKRGEILEKTTGALVLRDVNKLNQMISEGWNELN